MAQSIPVLEGTLTGPRVRLITAEHPWHWLEAGWRDTLKSPVSSVFYGIVFTLMGYYLLHMVQYRFHLALALTASFFLVGPLLATGLYDISRHLERGESITLIDSLLSWTANTKGFALFGIAIGLIMIVWVRLSGVMFGVTMQGATINVESDITSLYFSGDGLRFLIVFAVVGAMLATLVFSISVVSIPMMLDCKTDIITAIVTSITAVRANPGPMALWAALIVIFTGVGLATFYIGLAITMPLVGHATWYAYRDLVEPGKTSA